MHALEGRTLRPHLRAWLLASAPEALTDLTYVRVLELRQRMVDAGLRPGSVNARLLTITGILASAVRSELLASSPLTGRAVLLDRRDARSRIASPAEQATLISRATPRLGTRLGEILALRRSDCDLDRRVATMG